MAKVDLTFEQRLALGLDVPSAKIPETMELFGSKVGMAKVNRAFLSGGFTLLNSISATGTLSFLDLKWLDIPETVKGYIEEMLMCAVGLGMFNVHALGGYDMMHEGMELLKEKWGDRPNRPLMAGVTILTSVNTEDLKKMGIQNMTAAELTIFLAKLIKEAGLDGIIASGENTEAIRKEVGDDILIITPGLRFEDAKVKDDDQKRPSFVDVAFANGTDIGVMARPLLQGGLNAVDKAYGLIAKGLKQRGVAF